MADDDSTTERDLPLGLRTLWRRVDRRRSPPQPALTLDRIVAAAIEIADAEGLPALSIARLAERLGSAPMSLYRHFASKDELQLLMADTASGEASPQIELDAGEWRCALERWARELRAVYARHPWILQVTTSRPPLEPGQLAWLETGLRTLRSTALDPRQKISVIMLMLHYVRGVAQLAAVRVEGSSEPMLADREMLIWYGRMLVRLIDAERFPALAELIAGGAFEPSDEGGGEIADFDFGLGCVLDGIEKLVNSTA